MRSFFPSPLSSAGFNPFAHPYDGIPRCPAHPPILFTQLPRKSKRAKFAEFFFPDVG